MHVHVLKSWEKRPDGEWAEIRSAIEGFGFDVVADRESVCVIQQGGLEWGGAWTK